MTMYRHNAETCRAQRSWHLCMALPLGRVLAIQEGKMVHAVGNVLAVGPIACLAVLCPFLTHNTAKHCDVHASQLEMSDSDQLRMRWPGCMCSFWLPMKECETLAIQQQCDAAMRSPYLCDICETDHACWYTYWMQRSSGKQVAG